MRSSRDNCNPGRGFVRRARQAICPCFAGYLTTADKGESDYDGVHEEGIELHQRALGSFNIYRSRFAFDAEVTDRSRRFPRGMLAKDEPYVVHTSVDYTNCLVPRLDLIVASPYYWGVMDRYEAEALLENKPEGTFLLRDSAQTEYLFSVSFRRYKRTLHARIEQKNHRFSFDSSDPSIYSADTITDLISYYKDPTKCLFFEPQLSAPLPRTYTFSLQQLCRARIASLTTYDGVEKLSLPAFLKRFIQEYHYKYPVKTINHIPCTDSLDAATTIDDVGPSHISLA